MVGEERADLVAILTDGRRQDAAADCLRLLRELNWVSPEEKADFWRSLPPLLRAWLRRGRQPIAS